MNVVELALIKQIVLGQDSTEIKMILTTPFCPYAGAMIQQVKEQAESVVDHAVKVTLLAERWDPRDAGPDVVSGCALRTMTATASASRAPSRPAAATTARPGSCSAVDRVRKDDPRTEATGAIDEAVAALGLARAELGMKAQYGVLPPASAGWATLILRVQRELFVVGAELATSPDARAQASSRTARRASRPAMVEGVEEVLREMEAAIELPREFVVPGETRDERRPRDRPATSSAGPSAAP